MFLHRFRQLTVCNGLKHADIIQEWQPYQFVLKRKKPAKLAGSYFIAQPIAVLTGLSWPDGAGTPEFRYVLARGQIRLLALHAEA